MPSHQKHTNQIGIERLLIPEVQASDFLPKGLQGGNENQCVVSVVTFCPLEKSQSSHLLQGNSKNQEGKGQGSTFERRDRGGEGGGRLHEGLQEQGS